HGTSAQLAGASLRLRGVFRTTEPVLTVPVPGPLLMEIALRTLVEHRALVLVAGPAGETLARATEALGKEVLRLMVRPGEVVEPAHLARFLAGPPVDSVVLAHADLGAGTLAPLAELARVVRARRELLLLVEASGSLGARRRRGAGGSRPGAGPGAVVCRGVTARAGPRPRRAGPGRTAGSGAAAGGGEPRSGGRAGTSRAGRGY